MGSGESAGYTEPIPEVCPWLQVGWIFRDGDVQAIARQGKSAPARTAPERDE